MGYEASLTRTLVKPFHYKDKNMPAKSTLFVVVRRFMQLLIANNLYPLSLTCLWAVTIDISGTEVLPPSPPTQHTRITMPPLIRLLLSDLCYDVQTVCHNCP